VTDDDELNFPRGCAFGAAISAVVWVVFALVVIWLT
jgi:hypothetical protein